MKKFFYWLRKCGMLRTASYKIKGDANKLNEMIASDGGMLQSQREIDKEHLKKQGK